MTLERARLAPRTGKRSEHRRAAAVVALLLAAAGVVAGLWRPLAPALLETATELDTFAPEVLRTVAAYREPRYLAGALRLALGLAVPLAVVVLPAGRRLVARVAGPRARSAARGGLVAAVITLLGALAFLPLDLWIGYFQAGQWGFRTADATLWARDWLVSTGLALVGTFLTGTGFLWAVGRWPRSWHWRLVTLGTALAAVMVLAFPLVVEPLFATKRPLPEGPVREEVESVLRTAGEEGLPILVEDASTRTTKINAYVSGLGPTRQVVLYDTLIALGPEQVAAVVAHELAHRQHHDLARGVLLSATGLVLALVGLRLLWGSPGAAALVGARGPADPRLVAVAMTFVALANLVGQPVANLASRRAEVAADHRAMELTGEPATLVRMARTFVLRDLSHPDPPAWSRFLWGTHPSASERVRAAVAEAERRGSPLPTLEEMRAVEEPLRHPAIADGEG